MTTYGGNATNFQMLHWWKMHVETPCSRGGAALAFVQKIEGTALLPLPSGMTYVGSSAPDEKATRAQGDAGNGQPPIKKRRQGQRQGQLWALTNDYPYTDQRDTRRADKGKGKEGKGKGKGKGKEDKGKASWKGARKSKY